MMDIVWYFVISNSDSLLRSNFFLSFHSLSSYKTYRLFQLLTLMCRGVGWEKLCFYSCWLHFLPSEDPLLCLLISFFCVKMVKWIYSFYKKNNWDYKLTSWKVYFLSLSPRTEGAAPQSARVQVAMCWCWHSTPESPACGRRFQLDQLPQPARCVVA